MIRNNNRSNSTPRPQGEFEEKVIRVNRVSKKTKGGNHMGFSILTVVGDKKGRVGVGLGKGPDVASSIRKGITYAKKHLITVPLRGTTIPHPLNYKYGAARIMLKPAPKGAGLIAGGVARSVLAAAGVRDVVAKTMGTRNAISNVYCVFAALGKLKAYDPDKSKNKA